MTQFVAPWLYVLGLVGPPCAVLLGFLALLMPSAHEQAQTNAGHRVAA